MQARERGRNEWKWLKANINTITRIRMKTKKIVARWQDKNDATKTKQMESNYGRTWREEEWGGEDEMAKMNLRLSSLQNLEIEQTSSSSSSVIITMFFILNTHIWHPISLQHQPSVLCKSHEMRDTSVAFHDVPSSLEFAPQMPPTTFWDYQAPSSWPVGEVAQFPGRPNTNEELLADCRNVTHTSRWPSLHYRLWCCCPA